MDDFRIDSQKITHHIGALNKWLKTGDVYPIYAEISPSGTCNHRCIFCALDYLEYKPKFIDTPAVKRFIADAAKKGLRSIMFAGEGEPLLHPGLMEMVSFARTHLVDTAITTNGVLLDKNNLSVILNDASWLRISLNAATPESYARIHRARPEDFLRVLHNLRLAVSMRRAKNYQCTIGAQILLLGQNIPDAGILAKLCRQIGLDYLIIKPYSQHPFSKNRLSKTVDYRKLLILEKELAKFSTKDFKVIFRRHTMQKIISGRNYKQCYALPFWTYISANADVYACSAFLGDKRFCLGNITRERFFRIWNGRRRKKLLRMMANTWDINNCRQVCRMDEINRYLWELKNPPRHVNFI